MAYVHSFGFTGHGFTSEDWHCLQVVSHSEMTVAAHNGLIAVDIQL